MKHIFLILSLVSTLVLTACSGGSSSDGMGGRSGNQKGLLTLGVTDAAVDDIKEVWIKFTEIVLKPENGPSITFEFDSPLSVNLLDLQGSLSMDFFNNELVDAGKYNWIRLGVLAKQDGMMDSYVVLKDESVHELFIPSGAQTGLKINTAFTVDPMSSVFMTVDFDLRRSIVIASGEYHLKPVLRLINDDESDSIVGSVASDLTTGVNCSDALPETGNAVYLFAGPDANFDDIDGTDPEPVTTALLSMNTETGNFDYEIGFIPVGDYTLAFTCMADLDDPEADDAIIFTSLGNVSVDAPVNLGGADLNR